MLLLNALYQIVLWGLALAIAIVFIAALVVIVVFAGAKSAFDAIADEECDGQ